MNTHIEFRNAYVAALVWTSQTDENETEQYFYEIANGFGDF